MTARCAAIILAAGSGERLERGEPKAFLSIGGPTMLEVAMRSAAASEAVSTLVVAVPAGFEEATHAVKDLGVPIAAVTGGPSRQASVIAALSAVGDEPRVVCHDAARPFASSWLFTTVISALDDEDVDGVVPVIAIADTVKRVRDHQIVATEPRDELMLAQTPQAFRTDVLRSAHQRAAAQDQHMTDDAALLEWAGYRVRTVPGEPDNMKITTPIDLARAEAIVKTGGALR